ncbi:hypothetical protein JYP51_14715 [Ponticoccus gilvus]|nr:hypothetical protein [Enemella evansiae]
MTERRDDSGLDAFFAAARETPPQPDAAFLARLTEGALDEQMAQAGSLKAGAQRMGLGLWSGLRQALGGWPGLAGLAAACAAGVWLGVSPPEGMGALWDSQQVGLGQLGVDPVSAYDLAMIGG